MAFVSRLDVLCRSVFGEVSDKEPRKKCKNVPKKHLSLDVLRIYQCRCRKWKWKAQEIMNKTFAEVSHLLGHGLLLHG